MSRPVASAAYGAQTSTDPGPLLRIVKDQRIAFLVVGAANTAIGFGWFTLFNHLFSGLRFGYMLALLCAHVCATLCAFFLYRGLVFRVHGKVLLDLMRFWSVYLVSLGINALVLPALVEGLGWNPLASQAVIVLITTVLSYVGHKNFSFRRSATPEVNP